MDRSSRSRPQSLHTICTQQRYRRATLTSKLEIQKSYHQ
jgi:hypothetical protein